MSVAASTSRLRAGQLLRLAVAELWHERWLAFCAACVIAATLAPLWVLWGLEQGVVGTLIERQDRDPVMRQVLPESSGGHRFDAAWFERVAKWPETAFVMPSTRSIANQVYMVGKAESEPQLVELLPTAAGDPLLGGAAAPPAHALALSAAAAQRLRVAAGGKVRVALERQREGRGEHAVLDLAVAAVLPSSGLDRVAALAPLALLEEVQAWRDGHTVAGFGSEGSGPPDPITVYPLFRLYAPSIGLVSALAARLEAEGVSTFTREREIEATLGLQRNLLAVLGLVGLIAAAGAVVALSALQLAHVQRKRRDYAVLKLTGHGGGWLAALPCLNALAVALAGAVLAFAFYAATAFAINRYFAGSLSAGEAAVRMDASGLAAGVLGALLISALPALWGGWRASKVEAADELREN